jgi:predicted DNA-binding protein
MSNVSQKQTKTRSFRFPKELDDRITELSTQRLIPRSAWVIKVLKKAAKVE